MIPKRIIINIIWQSYYSKIDHRLRYIGVKDFSNELNCKKSLNLIQYFEDDILNYSSTFMFRGTPCISYALNQPILVIISHSHYSIELPDQNLRQIGLTGFMGYYRTCKQTDNQRLLLYVNTCLRTQRCPMILRSSPINLMLLVQGVNEFWSDLYTKEQTEITTLFTVVSNYINTKKTTLFLIIDC